MTSAAARIESGGMAGVYRRIGVASTFSPRFLAVLAEADRVARKFDGALSVIHAAEEDGERAARFREALSQLGRAAETTVLWSPGPSPADGILEACRGARLDLLVAGALEREGDHRNFVGGVARQLVSRAECDLLLVPNPKEAGAPCSRVVVAVDLRQPNLAVLNRACAIASTLKAREMVFLGVVTPFDEAMAANRGETGSFDEERLAEIVEGASGFDGPADCHLLRSTTGFAVCDFVQGTDTDLLIAAATREENLRFLPAHMDWLAQVIPTNVLMMAVEPAAQHAV